MSHISAFPGEAECHGVNPEVTRAGPASLDCAALGTVIVVLLQDESFTLVPSVSMGMKESSSAR